MPKLRFTKTEMQEVPSFWLIMVPMLTMLLTPALASMLAMEKEDGLMEMIKTEGGAVLAYFLGNYFFCVAYSTVFSSMFICVLYFSGANEDPAVQLPWIGTIGLILMWAHAQTCFCGFLGFAVFSRARHAAICGVLVIPMSSISGWVITAFSKGAPISWMCYILPPLAYSRTVGMLLMFGGGPEYWKGIAQLLGWSMIYGGLAVLRLVRPNAGAELITWVRNSLSDTVDDAATASNIIEPPEMDDDVLRAEEEACRMQPADAAILLQKLTKTFDARAHGKRVVKRAVDELCLAVPAGQMFGLLGPNGAGKTTTVCILTGLTVPNGGTASIHGCDIATQMRAVHRVIGVCPQFDIVWPDLTVCQHLASTKVIPTTT